MPADRVECGPEVIARPGTRHRFLIFCHQRLATQEIHFLRPLRRARFEGICQVALVEESDLDGVGPGKRPRALAALWRDYRPTLVIFSRYAGPDHTLLIAAAKAGGTPIVAHTDDDLFEVPGVLGHDKKRFHNAPERVASLAATFTAADLIYVPTRPLAERIAARGFSAPVVVPPIQICAEPEELTPPVANDSGSVTIGYMGSISHQHDLQDIVPAIERLLATPPSIRFETFGSIRMPINPDQFPGQTRAHPPVKDYASFLVRLRDLRWDIGLAPLRPIDFNRFRTYTKWLEYSLGGICVVASDSIVYRDVMRDGAGYLVNGDDWFNTLSRLVAEPETRRDCVRIAQERIRRELGSEPLAAQLLALEDMARERATAMC
jgi:glycosyltransferase involved in cell wall biosynthesis